MSLRTVEILEANATLRRLMSDGLDEVGLDAVDQQDEVCGLLVVDVDSGTKNIESRVAAYIEADLPVLYCGLRSSRERFPDTQWLDRPFSLTNFMLECLKLLDVKPEESTSPSLLIPSVSERETLPSGPPTREIPFDEFKALESELGGSLQSDTDALKTESEAAEFDIEDDSSMIMAVEDIAIAVGGRLSGVVAKRRVDTAEIVALRRKEDNKFKVRRPTMNQTMPDTPIAINADVDQTGETTASQPPLPEIPEIAEVRELGDTPSRPDPSSSQFTTQVRGVANMLAESWERIALTARTEDRADRIERVLFAALNDGLRGASDVIQRIPPSTGFAGSLSSMSMIDLLRTIRDRRMKGRLELAIGKDAFVLYVDCGKLQDIDVLSGGVEKILLDILHQGGALTDEVYQPLVEQYEAGEVFEQLEMLLIAQNLVSDSALQSARVVRAKEIFRTICGMRGGQFAFLEIITGDGQTWPVEPLGINVDELLLEILRESSFDTGDSKATARTKLVLDPNRAASLATSQLTELERSVLMVFRQGETLSEARERLEKLAGKETVDRVVDRLKKLELLRRSEPLIPVPDALRASVVTPVATEDKHERPTAVKSLFNIPISDVDDDEPNDEPTVSGVHDSSELSEPE